MMGDLIAVVVVFFLGVLVGTQVSSTPSVSNNQLLEASMACAVNSDLERVEITSTQSIAYCLNGAQFKLKEK
jgi:hypothetical protein